MHADTPERPFAETATETPELPSGLSRREEEFSLSRTPRAHRHSSGHGVHRKVFKIQQLRSPERNYPATTGGRYRRFLGVGFVLSRSHPAELARKASAQQFLIGAGDKKCVSLRIKGAVCVEEERTAKSKGGLRLEAPARRLGSSAEVWFCSVASLRLVNLSPVSSTHFLSAFKAEQAFLDSVSELRATHPESLGLTAADAFAGAPGGRALRPLFGEICLAVSNLIQMGLKE